MTKELIKVLDQRISDRDKIIDRLEDSLQKATHEIEYLKRQNEELARDLQVKCARIAELEDGMQRHLAVAASIGRSN